MKKLITLLVLATSFSLSMNAQGHDHSDPNHKHDDVKKEAASSKKTITFKKTEIERLNIPYGSDETFTFEFKNTGKEPIIINNVQTSCGCTTAKKPNEPVLPKKSSSIAVKYDTKRVGSFTKTITVTTNVSEPIVLTIKGTVLPEKKEGDSEKKEESKPEMRH
jgi:hypothetical protein